jgi:hypothetical protein
VSAAVPAWGEADCGRRGIRAHMAQGGMTMNVVCKRIRLGRAAAVAAGAFIVALVPLTAAQAATTPIHFTETESDSFTDTTTCSFPVTVTFTATRVGNVFFDAQGNFRRLIAETNSVGTNSANGITLRESDHTVDFFNAAGYDKETGLPIHIQDGGVVIRDAGYLLFNPDESVAVIHGPHPQLEGDPAAIAAYCAALS